jgi:hypothetical protein
MGPRAAGPRVLLFLVADGLAFERLATLSRFPLGIDAAFDQNGTNRMVGIDDVQDGVDDAMRGTSPLSSRHRPNPKTPADGGSQPVSRPGPSPLAR